MTRKGTGSLRATMRHPKRQQSVSTILMEVIMPTATQAIKRLRGLNRQHIAVAIWCEDDVIERAKENGIRIGRRQAREIIDRVDHHQDCTIGITWDTLDYYIDEIKGKRLK